MKKRVAIYARVSTLNQAIEGYSIEAQVNSLRKYCEALGYEIYEEYIDAGYSGGNLDRPAIQKLIKDVKNYEAVVITQLDRVSRDTRDTLYLVRDVFDKHDVAFISMKDNLDTSTSTGALFLTLLSAVAEFERSTIRERMLSGKVGRAKSGKPMSWTVDPFGYRYVDDTYEIIPIESDIVKEMFDYYAHTGSITSVVTMLNRKGHIAKEVPWSYRTVKMVLMNPIYIGKNRYQGEVYDGNHEPIITKDLFDKVQDLIDQGRRKSSNPRPFEAKYLLSGLIRCGECGAPMMMMMGRVRKDGTRPMYYRCKSNKKYIGAGKDYYHLDCDNTSHKLDDLEFYAMAQIEKLRIEPQSIAEVSDDNSERIKLFEQEIDKLNEQLYRVLDLYVSGSYPREILDDKRDRINEQIISLEIQIDELQGDDDTKKDEAKQAIKDLKLSVFKMSHRDKFILFREVIEQVTVYKDEMAIEWLF